MAFFTTVDYVLRRLKSQDKVNLLAVIFEPDQDCKDLKIDDDEFVAYFVRPRN